MNTVKRKDWHERLEKRRREEKEATRAAAHPLAAMKEDTVPENVLAKEGATPAERPLGELGLGGGKSEDLTLPTDTKEDAAKTRADMKAEAEDRLLAGKTEREQANEKSEELYAALSAFADKQNARYDELLSMVKENDYRSLSGARELLYDYLLGAENAKRDTAARLAAENGGAGDSYSAAMAARAKNEYVAKGDSAAREYYADYLDRILRVLQASGGDMNDLFGNMQDNVDTAEDVANRDLSLGADLLKALADAEAAERKIEAGAFSDMLDHGNTTAGMEISPMRLDAELKSLQQEGEGGGYTTEEALMLLWDRYPGMRSYILSQYIEHKNRYTFE